MSTCDRCSGQLLCSSVNLWPSNYGTAMSNMHIRCGKKSHCTYVFDMASLSSYDWQVNKVRSTRHNVVKPYGQLVTRLSGVTSWPCDGLTGSRRISRLYRLRRQDIRSWMAWWLPDVKWAALYVGFPKCGHSYMFIAVRTRTAISWSVRFH